MGSMRTKEDEVQRISTSVFVTNFPEQSCAKDLWNACMQYGYVVDAFISNRRSKAGKRFGFVRFIKVFDVERLRPNLNSNSKQFSYNGEKRNNMHEDKKDNRPKDNSNSYVHAVKGCSQVNKEVDNIPTLVLDESCVNQQDYSCCLNGKVKDFEALSNLKVVLRNEGFDDIVLRYLGGLWVLIEFTSVEIKEKFQSNVGTGGMSTQETVMYIQYMTGTSNIFESFKLNYKDKVYWARAKEVVGWIPDFVELNDEDSESGDEHSEGDCKEDLNISDAELEGENDVTEVLDIVFEKESPRSKGGEDFVGQSDKQSEDPFNIYPLLNKNTRDNNKSSSTNDSLKYPPGFTPGEDEEAEFEKSNKGNSADSENGSNNNWSMKGGTESGVLNHFKKVVPRRIGLTHKAKKDWVKELYVSNKVNFLSLQETKMKSIELFDIKRCWGNFAFDYVYSALVGNSGGILFVWDSNSFMKINATISDYFVMVRGTWVTNGKVLLIISVYAPQDLTEKKMLWDYLCHVIANWKGEVIVIGDFNEVHNKNERFGSVFNLQGVNAFNSFILSASLEEVPLGGCSFTWCHRSASKMSKFDRFLISENLMNSCPNFLAITLDRYLFDHCPILLRESKYNYGPIPFRFFHYWLEVDGFKKLVNEAWLEVPVDASNAMLNLMYQLKYLKKKIRAWNGMRKSYKNSKFMLKMELADLEAIIDKGNASDDIITKRMEVINSIQELDKLQSMETAQKAKIKWAIEGDENSNHFKKRFEGPNLVRPILNMEFPRHLNSIQKADIEAEVSNEEIKRAIWDFGIDKSPRPDGFTFGFYRHFWNFESKSLNATKVKDYVLSVLIGSLYKIIAKILANRLVMVLGDIVNEVDFEKAYDSVRWDYLDDVLKSLALERDGVDGFKSAFGLLGPRSGVEHSQLVDLLAKIEGVSLGMMNDRWTWTLEGSGVFSVASVRKLIDDRIEVAFRHPEGSSPTRRLMMPCPINAFLSALTCSSKDAEWHLWGAA
ncbi:RNA-directed DNA polymerase, eukaryota [Tanacetum coccineum]